MKDCAPTQRAAWEADIVARFGLEGPALLRRIRCLPTAVVLLCDDCDEPHIIVCPIATS